MGHLIFKKIKILPLLGIIQNRLANDKTPKYEGCIYGSMTKSLWRTKGVQASATQKVIAPGKQVLADQLDSPLPVFLDQLKGRLTKHQYRAATVFFD